jgi:sulfite oxidase
MVSHFHWQGSCSRRQFFVAGGAALAAASLGSHCQSLFAQQAAGQAASAHKLIVRSGQPLNAEPALGDLAAAQVTPTSLFYVRNHGPIPQVNEQQYKLRIEGLVKKPVEISVRSLVERFERRSVEATLTCAGNRRQEMSAIKPIGGVQWDAGAIGNARWSGISLADFLKAAEIAPDAKHVWFEGLDPLTEKDGSVAPFGGSIPLDRALDPAAALLLADRMNDEKLTAEHGFPLRTIVPGYIGARSVKWLSKITLSDRPSPNHYLAAAYKIVSTDSPEAQAAAEPIYPFPVNAAICTPHKGSSLKAGPTQVSGYALPSGQPGCAVDKVELSIDGGRTWRQASLEGRNAPFAWRLWSAEVTLMAGRQELVVRATDSRGNTMPEQGTWNAKGYLYNAWHRVSVDVA